MTYSGLAQAGSCSSISQKAEDSIGDAVRVIELESNVGGTDDSLMTMFWVKKQQSVVRIAKKSTKLLQLTLRDFTLHAQGEGQSGRSQVGGKDKSNAA